MATKNKDKEPKIKVRASGGINKTSKDIKGALGGYVTAPVPGTKGKLSLTASGGGGGIKPKGEGFSLRGGGNFSLDLKFPIGKKKQTKPKLYGY